MALRIHVDSDINILKVLHRAENRLLNCAHCYDRECINGSLATYFIFSKPSNFDPDYLFLEPVAQVGMNPYYRH